MKIRKMLSAEETLELISKPFLRLVDIKKLACCGYDKASKIRDEILKILHEKNYYVPSGLLPTDVVVNYLKINIDYLRQFI